MSPENTHTLMGFYMILGVNTMYMLFCFFKLFLIMCIGYCSTNLIAKVRAVYTAPLQWYLASLYLGLR